MNDLDKFLDEHPCKMCGGHYNDHDYLKPEDLEEAKERGFDVDICETYINRVMGEGETYFCRLVQLPQNPCDEEYMKEISSE